MYKFLQCLHFAFDLYFVIDIHEIRFNLYSSKFGPKISFLIAPTKIFLFSSDKLKFRGETVVNSIYFELVLLCTDLD